MTPLAFDLPGAAAAAGVTERTIRAWIANGWLKAKRQSRNKDGNGTGQYVIPAAALLDCIENNLPEG
jgi:hypothetical protein